MPRRDVRLRWMDTLRATAVFLVVLEHAIVLTPGELPHGIVGANGLLTPFRIPTLMFLSGMLLQKSLQKSRRGYVRGKVYRILWQYLVWSGILLLVKLPGKVPGDVVQGVLLNPESPMWYLAYLFCFYLLVLVLPTPVRAWVIPFAMASVTLFPAGSNWGRFVYVLAFFLAGDLFARHIERLLPVIPRRRVLIPLSLMGLSVAVASALGYGVRYNAALAVFTLAGILAVIPAGQWLSRTRIGERVAALGGSTLIFYVASFPAQIVSMHAADAVGASPLGVAAVNLVAGLGSGYIALRLQDRFRPLRYLFELRPGASAPPRPSRQESAARGGSAMPSSEAVIP